jgi:cytochrome c peroxidase
MRAARRQAMRRFIQVSFIIAPAVAGSAWLGNVTRGVKWSAEERATLASMSIASLGALPKDPSNRVADDTAAQALGRKLFFDERLSGNGKVACATCHLPAKDFQDGTPLGHGVGVTNRRTMPIAGTAHSPWMFWDGRKDSQWSQALGPLESSVEHGGDRAQYARHIAAFYRREYEQVFGRIPDLKERENVTRVFANMGKAIAAFERTITFDTTRFDRYVAAEVAGRSHTAADSLSPDEEAGLRLFIGKASCVNCHNGPRLTDDHFHNTGVPVSPLVAAVDSGRATGARQVMADEFNCLSRYSDARPDECSELRFAVTEGEELLRAYKTPSLRNVTARAPFMHAGQIATLDEVIAHYSRAPKAPFGKSELKRLRLSDTERRQIAAYLGTLTAAPLIKGARIP